MVRTITSCRVERLVHVSYQWASVSGYRLRVHTKELRIETGSREQVHDLTAQCRAFLHEAGAGDDLLHVWVPHATAGLAVIETGAGSDTDIY